MHAFPTEDDRFQLGRPVLRAVRPGPFAVARRVPSTETEEDVRARLDATAVNRAYRAALRTAATVRQVSLHDFLR